MIKNYLKTAWRSLSRNRSYTAINITGLTVGIAACLLIFLVVQFETSFDNFHSKKDQIYRVTSNSGVGMDSGVPFPTTAGLRLDFPQLKNIAVILRNDGSNFSVTDNTNAQNVKKFKEDETYYSEPQFFDIFDFGWLAGDKRTALSEPNTVVLTQDEANKFFGDWKIAIGKTIRYKNKLDLKVTGILKNMPINTDFPLKIVMSYATVLAKGSDYYYNLQDWVSVFGENQCYVVLPANLSVASFNSQLDAFAKRHKPAQYAKQGYKLQALKDMHYDTKVEIFSLHPFSKQLINAISLIGIFLLVIACVNFINLATAQAVNRSKEVGIRKVLGSNRKQLAVQFISETAIITLFSILLAAVIAGVALPFLNNLLEIKLSTTFFYDSTVVLFLAATFIIVTSLSGFYPALVLSGFNPISALKNRITKVNSSGISLRRALVVLQFCIAQVLVIGTLVIISQMDYFKNKSLGFDKDAIITVPIPGDSISQSKTNALRNLLLQQPGIKDVSYSFGGPSDDNEWDSGIRFNNSPKETDFNVNLKWADVNYFKLYNLHFIAGHPYASGDTVNGYVVNETLLKKLGISNPQQAIGKYIGLWNNRHMHAPIVGVVQDFNIYSLKEQIPPVILVSLKSTYHVVNIKMNPVDVKQTLSSVEKLWNGSFPEYLYEYRFLDDKIASFYKTDSQLSALYKVFAGIAIFISCLGLYGLVSFMAVQRTREVGIRKTLGASVANIVLLFSKEFTMLILVAFVISAPVGWYFMNSWLEGFTYKITIGPGIFVLAMGMSIIIAWVSVGYKAIIAALANPVKSLKSE